MLLLLCHSYRCCLRSAGTHEPPPGSPEAQAERQASPAGSLRASLLPDTLRPGVVGFASRYESRPPPLTQLAFQDPRQAVPQRLAMHLKY